MHLFAASVHSGIFEIARVTPLRDAPFLFFFFFIVENSRRINNGYWERDWIQALYEIKCNKIKFKCIIFRMLLQARRISRSFFFFFSFFPSLPFSFFFSFFLFFFFIIFLFFFSN